MFTQGNSLATSIELLPPEPYPVHENTYGLEVVHQEEVRVFHELHAGWMEEQIQQIDATSQLLGKVCIETGGVDQSLETDESVAADRSAELCTNAQRLHEYAAMDAQEMHGLLFEARSKMMRLTEVQREMLDGYMDRFASPFLRNVKIAEKGDGVPWATWLAGSASDEELVNVLQWHVDTLARQQTSPEIQEIIAETEVKYIRRVEEGVAQGWIGKHAKVAIKKIAKMQVYVGDIFDTVLCGWGGYHVPGTNDVVIAQGHGTDIEHQIGSFRKSIFHAMFHEIDHTILENDETEADKPLRSRWIMEALTEHIALALKYGHPEAITTVGREGKVGAYVYERNLLADFLSYGKIPVNPALATKAYSGDEQDKARFYEALDKAWGPGALQAMNERINIYEKQFLADGQTARFAQIKAVEYTHADLLKHPEKIFHTLPDEESLPMAA